MFGKFFNFKHANVDQKIQVHLWQKPSMQYCRGPAMSELTIHVLPRQGLTNHRFADPYLFFDENDASKWTHRKNGGLKSSFINEM